MNRFLISIAAFVAVTIGAPTAAEAKRVRLRWLSGGAHDDESGMFWFIVVGALIIGLAWVAFKAISKPAKEGGGVEDAAKPAAAAALGKLARSSSSEERSNAESAWANKALARVEECGQQVTGTVGATPRVRATSGFKPAGTAANSAPRASFGKR